MLSVPIYYPTLHLGLLYYFYYKVEEGRLKEIDWLARDSLEDMAPELDFEIWAGFGETGRGRHSKKWYWQDRDA